MTPSWVETRALDVHLRAERVGTLTRTTRGARFEYLEDYAALQAASGFRREVAWSLPVRTAAHEVRGVNLHPFFAGLLPEGLRFRALVRGIKTSEDDLFSMLAATGGDAVGAVAVTPRGEPLLERVPLADVRKPEEVSFREWYAASIDWAGEGGDTGIAGVQPKVSGGMISFPVRARDSRRQFIVKLTPADCPQLVENEAFFMRLAASVGLPAAKVRIAHDREGASALIVERFDRDVSPTGGVLKIPQEDASQLLDRYPADKYGLSLREIAMALEVCSAPLPARLRLIQLVAFSYLIVNGDLHAKNVSVQESPDGLVQLTPGYDLLSTLPYGDDRQALKIEGRDIKVRRAHFTAFGEGVGVRRAATEAMLTRLVEAVERKLGDRDGWDLAQIGLPAKKTRHLQREIVARLDDLRG